VIFTSDNQDIYTCTNDAIKNTSSSLPNDIIGQSLITFNNSCILHPVLSQRGVYTVSIWNPSFFDSSTNTNARLNVAVMDAFKISKLVLHVGYLLEILYLILDGNMFILNH
jgi:hypothetical protein